ncbi:MAG TPA: hypothetical protein VMH38_05870 [Thermoplasmata archaeon]|nr:hypothetical protein [Thermoplasmata archaeon]
MPTRKTAKRPWGTPTLDLGEGIRFPFRREVPLPSDPGSHLPAAASAVLVAAGFEEISPPSRPSDARTPSAGGSDSWVGERWLPRRRGTASTAFLPIITVLIAACVLGGLDAYISNSLVTVGYWLLGAVVLSAAFWLRYGRVYDTDVAMVTLSRAAEGSPTTNSASVVFWAARVRSQTHSGTRLPAGVSGPIWLAAELGEIAREFQPPITESPAGPGPSGRRA